MTDVSPTSDPVLKQDLLDEASRPVAVPPPTIWTKLAYGFGSVAYGVKNGAFDYFLLIFYSQVIGLDARLVGLAILIALIVDALSDPIVGYWSDNLRSPWGRRHPFMYASALPVALSFFMLWNPPEGASQQTLFWFVLGFAILIRTLITLYETPSSALTPDLTSDYNQRSSLYSYRYFFGWTGGNAMTVLMFFFLFPAFATEAIPDGMFNREAYELYGIIASCAIFVAILVSAVGTHARIVHLKPPPPPRRMSIGRVFGEIFETLAERSFIALFIGALFGAVASGLAAGLSFYFLTYFWGFSEVERGLVLFGTFIAAAIGFILAPIVTRTIDKKRGAMIIGLIAFLGAPMPIALRLFDLLPPNGTAFIFWFVVITNIIDVGLIICFQILFSSMVADLVEQSELKTGRRSEGVFTAAVTFVRKAVQGFGVLAASMVLALAQFPTGADTNAVPEEAIWRLGAFYVPAILFLWMAMMAVISTYRIDRATHEDNLRRLSDSGQPAE
ncbi:MAG: sugar transporter [Alphaproteobacteria bacterium]|jgi:Na+/melibiose symporter-like transporter|nr:sugar transporter [Alphaproteobacteria bacterium]